MKPEINSKVWIIGRDDIYIETVGWLGEKSFVVELYQIKRNAEFRYDEYGYTWVNTFEEAKDILQKKLGPDAKIVEIDDEWWREEWEVEE